MEITCTKKPNQGIALITDEARDKRLSKGEGIVPDLTFREYFPLKEDGVKGVVVYQTGEEGISKVYLSLTQEKLYVMQ